MGDIPRYKTIIVFCFPEIMSEKKSSDLTVCFKQEGTYLNILSDVSLIFTEILDERVQRQAVFV
jgi:hypothetical protein